MLSIRFRTFVLLLIALIYVGDRSAQPGDAANRINVESGVKNPLRFEANRGQFGSDVHFVAQRAGAVVGLTDEGATLALRTAEGATSTLAFRLDGARSTMPFATDELATKTSYLRGSDPEKWIRNAPSFGRVTYPDVLEGVDLVFHGEEGQLEYDFVVAPGTDPSRISLAINGADRVSPTADGDLSIETAGGAILQRKPRVYQADDSGAVHEVVAGYRVTGTSSLGFEVAAYDRARPLVIDPVIVYSTYLGSTASEANTGSPFVASARSAVDANGNHYIVTDSDPPEVPGSKRIGPGTPDHDVLVSKLDSSGRLVYATYVGGTGTDTGSDLVVNGQGNVFFTGTTASSNYPQVGTALHPTLAAGDGDAILSELSQDGSSLVYSVLVDTGCTSAGVCGASNNQTGNSIAISGSTAYVLGATQGANPFVIAVDTPNTNVRYLSTFTGSGMPARVVADSQGRAYALVNSTNGGSASVTTAPRGWMRTAPTVTTGESYLVRLGASGAVEYGTYLGNADGVYGESVTLGPSGDAYIGGLVVPAFGGCAAPSTLPTTPGAYQTSTGPVYESGFIIRLDTNADGDASLKLSTFLGGQASNDTSGIFDIKVGADERIFVTGATSAADFPSVPATTKPDTSLDAFVAVLGAAGDTLAYSTFLGGTSSDYGWGIGLYGQQIDVFGSTASTTGFPTVNALQSTFGGGSTDAFLTSISFDTLTITPTSASVKSGDTVQFSASGSPNGVYSFVLLTNETGGTITGAGLYTAGPRSGRDVVFVSDTLGRGASANVTVISTATPLVLDPSFAAVAPRGRTRFTASGGQPPYAYSVSGTAGGSIDGNGLYTGGSIGPAAETITVTDQSSQVVSAMVYTTAQLTVTADAMTVGQRGTVQLHARGGSNSYTFTATDGSVTSAGLFTAPSSAGTVTVTVRDSLGSTVQLQIAVGGSLAINPPTAVVPVFGSVTFAASGGAGSNFTFTLLTSPPVGGSIDAATGVFTAGATGNVTETVQVSDRLGNRAVATVTVEAGPPPLDAGTSSSSSSTSSSSGSSSSSTSSSSGDSNAAPPLDAGPPAPTSEVQVGGGDGGCSSSPANGTSGVSAFALGMVGLALIRRRRAV